MENPEHSFRIVPVDLPETNGPMGLQQSSIVGALHSPRYVSGLTHQYYRYPAALSPELVREILRQYSRRGDTVLDPFAGGGTTLVEALAEGREAVGFDLNSLAVFVSGVKTRPLTRRQWKELGTWVKDLGDPGSLEVAAPETTGLPGAVGIVIAAGVDRISRVTSHQSRSAARCALLRLGQWALESRKTPPDREACLSKLDDIVDSMEHGMEALVRAAASNGISRRQIVAARRLLHASADTASTYGRAFSRLDSPPALVLTSPPYPRVHVLYSRWQVNGRRETSLPYEIARCSDGLPPSHYTLGTRSRLGEDGYYSSIGRAFRLMRDVMAPDGRLIQVVGFNRVESQLDRYMSVVENSGFVAEDISGLDRQVPNRRWYTRGTTYDSGREFLLVHRKLS